MLSHKWISIVVPIGTVFANPVTFAVKSVFSPNKPTATSESTSASPAGKVETCLYHLKLSNVAVLVMYIVFSKCNPSFVNNL